MVAVLEVIFNLPYPPSVNTIWRQFNGRTILSKQGREYRAAVAQSIKAEPMQDRLHVILDVFPPDNRRRDLDNVCKAVLDACTHAAVWGDDSQIDRLEINRRSASKPGAVCLTVRRL